MITNARLAAETIDRNLPTRYKTVGCMAAYLASHPSPGSNSSVTDVASGGLIEAQRTFFVPVVINDTTGERDCRAYDSRGMADVAAQVLHSNVLRWDAVFERARARA